MKNFIAVKIALLPFALCWALLPFTTSFRALAAGMLLSLLTLLFGSKPHGRLEWLNTIVLTCLTSIESVWPDALSGHVQSACLASIGLYSLGTVCAAQPWTADFARRAKPEFSTHPVFMQVNQAISGLWGVLFLALAGLSEAHAPTLWRMLSIALGVVLTAILPRFLPSLLLKSGAGMPHAENRRE